MTTEIVPVNEDYFKNKVFELGKIIREGGLVFLSYGNGVRPWRQRP